MTIVVNIYDKAFDVYIGRGKNGIIPDPPTYGFLGNPYKVEDHGLDEALRLFREYFLKRVENPKFCEAVLAVRGKRLGCFCKPKACHGDIIAEWVDAQ